MISIKVLGTPIGVPFSIWLAAAAVVIAAATVIGCYTVVAAATEQNQQNDNPAPVTAKTIVTHIQIPPNHFSTALPFIPRYSAA